MTKMQSRSPVQLVLAAARAEEVMTRNPVSIRSEATVKEAVALLADKEISAAPVIDRAGRAVGVVSRADIVRHDRETLHYLTPVADYYEQPKLPSGEPLREGFQVEVPDGTLVKDIMTPTVLSVTPETPVLEVVAEMLALKVHRLFVVDETGVLVGVISALDVLRCLRKPPASV